MGLKRIINKKQINKLKEKNNIINELNKAKTIKDLKKLIKKIIEEKMI